jgi:hypothetical protein
MPDHTMKAAPSSNIVEQFRQHLDKFEQHERQLLSEDRQERARQLTARFARSGFALSLGK